MFQLTINASLSFQVHATFPMSISAEIVSGFICLTISSPLKQFLEQIYYNIFFLFIQTSVEVILF